ncbi:MAG: rod shape-determining protein RodA [Spirochaetia bacterium]|nr:rod shape-determining protein RodA [Spirochaetia bacterium]
MKIKLLSLYDFLLFILVFTLTGIGILFIYSSGVNTDGFSTSDEYIRQLLWAGIGLVLMIIIPIFDCKKFQKYSFYIYAAGILLLMYTLLFGKEVNNAKSWIGFSFMSLQPSELFKIAYILAYGNYLVITKKMNPLKRFIISLPMLVIPMGLILIQPDFGTASVFIFIYLFMSFMANIPIRYLMILTLTGALAILFTVLPQYETIVYKKPISILRILTNPQLTMIVIASSLAVGILSVMGHIIFKAKYFYWITYGFGIFTGALFLAFLISSHHLMKPYQIQRLLVFLSPDMPKMEGGWQITQSMNAIGSGVFFGRGFLQGRLSHTKFLSQRSTDFIFGIFSEEAGFIGGIIFFAIYFTMLARILYIIKQTNNSYGTFICSGILGMFFYHFFINVGMTMGIMPITGIPLPFLSYGGSALLTNMIAIALVMGINSRRLDF